MINIPIFSTFKNAGFKAAEKATLGLNRSFQRLAITLGSALSIRKITQFGKASVRAFVEDNKAASALANTMNNLGMAFQSPAIEDYIKRLSQAAAVADDVLRPALGDLLRATNNLGKSQELLNVALDISASTGKDLRTVTTALSRAYLGNNASLSRLNAGLSKAFLASASFEEVQAKLEDMFSGSATQAAKTYAGQLARLSIAAEEAKEMIGQSLIQSIELLGNSTGIEQAQTKMEGFGRATSDVILGFSKLAKDITGGADGKKGIFGNFVELIGDLTRVNQVLADTRVLAAQARQELLEPVQRQSIRAIESESAASIKKWIKEQRALEKIRKEQERIAKAAKASREEAEKRRKILEKLSEAGGILDTEKANIEAALQNESLSENEVLRLKLKKAILNENADKALELASQLAKSQDELGKLKNLSDTFKPSNPFEAWVGTLDEALAKLAGLGAAVSPGVLAGVTEAAPIVPPSLIAEGVPSFGNLTQEDLYDAFGRGSGVMAPTINVTVQGTGDLSDETKQKVVDTIVEASRAGFSTGWYSTTARATL